MIVGVSRVEIFLPENHSLKDKRQSIKRIVEKARARFNISIMETEQTDLWQRAIIGFSIVGVNKDHVSSAMEKVFEYIESLYIGDIIDTKNEIIVIGDAV
jgi:uncharacterized protein YlxP (DUF503 family)